MAKTPSFTAQPNFALKEITHVGSNPIHIAHEQKAFAPQKFKQKGLANPQDNAPGTGSPWLQMMKGIK